MCGYCPICKELEAMRFLPALGESRIILSKSIFIALKATDGQETKWKSKFSSAAFKASARMILTPRKSCGGFFYPDMPRIC